jgi:hypothetical protein
VTDTEDLKLLNKKINFDIAENIRYSVEELGITKVIDAVGVGKVIDAVGISKVINTIGKKAVLDEIGYEGLVDLADLDALKRAIAKKEKRNSKSVK